MLTGNNLWWITACVLSKSLTRPVKVCIPKQCFWWWAHCNLWQRNMPRFGTNGFGKFQSSTFCLPRCSNIIFYPERAKVLSLSILSPPDQHLSALKSSASQWSVLSVVTLSLCWSETSRISSSRERSRRRRVRHWHDNSVAISSKHQQRRQQTSNASSSTWCGHYESHASGRMAACNHLHRLKRWRNTPNV